MQKAICAMISEIRNARKKGGECAQNMIKIKPPQKRISVPHCMSLPDGQFRVPNWRAGLGCGRCGRCGLRYGFGMRYDRKYWSAQEKMTGDDSRERNGGK